MTGFLTKVCHLNRHDGTGSPVIIVRWSLDRYIQLGIALPDETNIPQYLFKAIIIPDDTSEIPQLPVETTPLSENQEDVYWQIVLQAAEMSMKEGRLPYAALVQPSGKFNPIIIARNKNYYMGDGLDFHAECMALREMQDMGYKTYSYLDPENHLRVSDYHPILYTLAKPCHACSQMVREQRVAEVRYALEQPPGWDGGHVLLNTDLAIDCGPVPIVERIKDPTVRASALTILRKSNSGYHNIEHEGIFDRTIKINESLI